MNVYTAGKASCFILVVVVVLSINMANMCNKEGRKEAQALSHSLMPTDDLAN